MKNLLSLIFLLSINFVSAQNYYVVNNTGMDDSEFVYDAPSHQIHFFGTEENKDELFTEWLPLPFDWNFYGEPVSGYYISENGYITFDQNANQVSLNDNDALPTQTGPNNAIYAFWDDLVVNNAGETPTSTFTDRMFTWTFGTAPNRTHIVMWQNFALKSNDRNSYIYAVLAIHEGADFFIAHMNAKNLETATATVGAQNADGSEFYQVDGSPDYFINGFLAPGHEDDIVYRFFYGDQLDYDLKMLDHNLPDRSVANQSITVSGNLENFGALEINSFNLNYEINESGDIKTSLIDGISISPGSSYNFSHSEDIIPTTPGALLNIKIWASDLNGNVDEDQTNNFLDATLLVTQGTNVERNVLIEEATGAWCGYCPGGALVLEELAETYPDRVIPVSYHTNDAMEIPEPLSILNIWVGSYPSALIDRYPFGQDEDVAISNYNTWESLVMEQLENDSPLSISGDAMTCNDNIIRFSTYTELSDYVYGDLRTTCILVKESVVGQGSGYDQINYFSSESQAVGGTDHPYYNYPDPIVGYNHKFVATQWLVDDSWGNIITGADENGVYPPGFTESFSGMFPMPKDFYEGKYSVIAFNSYYNEDENKREVLNADVLKFGYSVSPTSNLSSAKFDIYPNPNSGQISIISQDENQEVNEVILCDINGKAIRNLYHGSAYGNLHLDLGVKTRGVYLLKILMGTELAVKRIVIN